MEHLMNSYLDDLDRIQEQNEIESEMQDHWPFLHQNEVDAFEAHLDAEHGQQISRDEWMRRRQFGFIGEVA